MRMKIELNSHELQIVMNALDGSHKRASNDIRNAIANKDYIDQKCRLQAEFCPDDLVATYGEIIESRLAKRADIVALKAKIRSLTKK